MNRFELFPISNAAADLVDHFPQGNPHGHFGKAGVVHLAGEGKNLRPLALFRADGGKIGAARSDNVRDIGISLHVVDVGGFSPQTFRSRERRSWARHAPLAFDGRKERSLLAANESSCSFLDVEGKTKVRAKNSFAQEMSFFGLLDGEAQTANSQGVFGPDVDVAFIGPYSVSCNGHSLED